MRAATEMSAFRGYPMKKPGFLEKSGFEFSCFLSRQSRRLGNLDRHSIRPHEELLERLVRGTLADRMHRRITEERQEDVRTMAEQALVRFVRIEFPVLRLGPGDCFVRR